MVTNAKCWMYLHMVYKLHVLKRFAHRLTNVSVLRKDRPIFNRVNGSAVVSSAITSLTIRERGKCCNGAISGMTL